MTREAFEKWYNQGGYYHDTVSDRKELMLEAWQARESQILTLLQSDEAREKVENEIAKKRVQSRLPKKLFNVEFVQPCDDDKRAATAALNALQQMIKEPV